MRWLATTIVALGTLIGASATANAAAAPGPGATATIPNVNQVEKVHRRWGHHHHGFGGFGLYIGPRYGGYYGGYPYYDDYYYYPRYRYRRWHRHRHHHHRRWHRRHRHW